MPAIMGDPASAAIYRATGAAPFPAPTDTQLPPTIHPLHITLRNGSSATILPVAALSKVPRSLADFLCAQMNSEIEAGDTYPMLEPFPEDAFAKYWFANFVAVCVAGSLEGVGALKEEGAWEGKVLGTFYIKPNYTGRSSHVSNAGFLVTEAARGKGVGRAMGEAYVRWAPELVSNIWLLSVVAWLTSGGRGTCTRSSTWCTRRTKHLARSGTRWVLRGSGG